MSTIFISGSSDGLGLLAAKSLLSQGHQVIIHARNELRAKQLANQIPKKAQILIGDFESIYETSQLALTLNEIGTFDAVIHNAGIYTGNGFSKDGFPKLFAVNTLAPYILTALMNKPKRLIYLSSQMHAHGKVSPSILEGIQKRTSDSKLFRHKTIRHDVIVLCG